MRPLANAVVDIADPVAYDIRGHGLSSSSGNYTAEALAADCVQLCASRLDAKPVLYGHGLGAEVAARAAKHTDVAGIVLEAPHTQPDTQPPSQERIKETLIQLREWRLRPHDAIKREFARKDPRFADALATAKKQLRPEITGIHEWEYTLAETLLADLNDPALVLQPQDAPTIDTDSTNTTVASIEGTTHTIARDAYPAVVMHLRGFLDRVFS